MRELIIKLLKYSDIKDLVEDNVRWALENRDMLNKEVFPSRPLGIVLEVIITRGYWRVWPKYYLIEKLKSYGVSMPSDELIINYDNLNLILKALRSLYEERKGKFWKETLESVSAFIEGLKRAKSLKNWISKLYDLTSKGGDWKNHEYFKGIKGLGIKGVELLLRDMGYFDRVPIDIHERRFLLRTGIALVYGSSSRDPATPEFYSEALRRYCEENLRGLEILGIPLNKSPGIIDWAIWYFTCEKESRECKAVCSSKPRCEICPLKNICDYAKLRNVLKNG